jgi:hypothetical protein
MNDVKPIKLKNFNWFQRRKCKKLIKKLEQELYNNTVIPSKYFN